MVIIAFEGKSDIEFFDSVLDSFNLPKNQVQYFNFGGKDNIFDIGYKHYDEIEKNYLDIVNKILLVVDADNKKDPNPNRGYNTSETKLKEIIGDLAFDVPIDYYIMCDSKKEGNLESFLLSVLDDEQIKCIKSFRKCYKYELSDKWAYNTFYKQKKEPFNFEHLNFKTLKQKLKNLFKEEN